MSTQQTLPGIKPFLKSHRPRPKITDGAVLIEAAKALSVRIADDIDVDLVDDVDDIAAINEIVDAIRSNNDGYKIARHLEVNYEWDPDFPLVEILDNALFCKTEALRAAVEQWVIDAQVGPTFKEGDRVTFTRSGKPYAGKVVAVYGKCAEYAIAVDGERDPIGNLLLDFEDCAAENAT